MGDFELRRIIFSLFAFLVFVFVLLWIALMAALDTKAILDHKAKVLKEELERKGVGVVDYLVGR
jgi:hypothetical protein